MPTIKEIKRIAQERNVILPPKIKNLIWFISFRNRKATIRVMQKMIAAHPDVFGLKIVKKNMRGLKAEDNFPLLFMFILYVLCFIYTSF